MAEDYWLKQQPDQPLFPDIEWSKPEQKSKAGRLGIVGGNKLGFVAVAESYQNALAAGVGEAKILLPDALRKVVPNSITDVTFSSTNQSGSFSKEALNDLLALGDWADGILLIGDSGKNSETAILFENFIEKYKGQLTITRDAVDLLINIGQKLVERPNTVLVTSFSQLQKIFQSVYYPKILTFSMNLAQVVESLHKFTLTYPTAILTLHQDHIVAANQGQVISTPWNNPMTIWRGQTATNATVYWIWNRNKPLEAIATSILKTG